ncbi:MAG TPA: diacylglycerol kinase family lipid kinase [Phycisphaerae bacterium]|nr:diacylglycerol kinase family lipid kinase [Phycisphaerae bacterium]HOM50707.1 diacylglycerol kinase family lipid kinase [Phycisphaerae bacterium]HON68551.1 diacylglycerol kinase family lipid kinase [Phycisphaerae bacterium]HPP26109.1 diacylglycerol kinase family lipid kinase [Phycisphaerae bacterium]HPU26547.1 diacylglycerol kinase family lipid kinase [Phycisphaerae bacterium]
MQPRILILWNPSAGSAGKAEALRAELQSRSGVVLRQVSSRDEVVRAATEAAEAKFELIVAAGGDGTVNAVVNALAEPGRELPLAILPLGTGNDLARTLAIPPDPQQAVELLASPRVERIDRVLLESPTRRIYYVNMGSAGFSGEVLQWATEEVKRWWGPLAYLRGVAQKLGELKPYEVILQFDDGPTVHEQLYNVVLANGRTTSGGMMLAPYADLQDGQVEVLLVRANGLTDLAVLASRYFAGTHLEDDTIVYRRAGRVRIQAEPPMAFSLDGDLVTDEPVTITVEKQVVPVVVGPEFGKAVSSEL